MVLLFHVLQFEPERLTEETMFVMGSKANK